MSKSIQLEIVAVLWIIAAMQAFDGGYQIWGWVFAINGVVDVVVSALFAVRDYKSYGSRF